jgi:hypothetical protein
LITVHSRTALSLVLMVLLAACGGGGGKSSSNAVAGGGTANGAPSISGQPQRSVQAGQVYSFQPSASDPEGSTLQFSVQNLPSWASFDSSTGRISGTPAASDVGTYSGIVIVASDGALSTQFGPFALEVASIGTGVATLSWTPPTANIDGSVLNNLSGYQVLYGRSAEELSSSVSINNPSVSRYVIENLSSGTWYFAVVAVNGQGTWSPLSNIATKTVS